MFAQDNTPEIVQDQRGDQEPERAVAERTDRPERRQTAKAAGEISEEKQQGHEDVTSRVRH